MVNYCLFFNLFISVWSNVPGKSGMAINIPNIGTFDGNYIDLGSPPSNCFGDLSLCENGMAFSLWFKLNSGIHTWPFLIFSKHVEIYMYAQQLHFNMQFYLKNNTHSFNLGSSLKMIYDQWQNVAVTYEETVGFKVYINGIKAIATFAINEISLVELNFQIGCKLNHNCLGGVVDELQFWDEWKDSYFIWLLANLK